MGNEGEKMSRRDFLRGVGASAAVAAGEIISADKADAAECNLGIDKLPEGVIKINPESFGQMRPKSIAGILASASQLNLIPNKLSLNDTASADSWQFEQQTEKGIFQRLQEN